MNHNLQACQIIGIDIAKNSFAVHGADATGNPVYKATCTRKKLTSSLEQAPRCQIFMEACGGAHQLGRELQRMGHAVGLIPPQTTGLYGGLGKPSASSLRPRFSIGYLRNFFPLIT